VQQLWSGVGAGLFLMAIVALLFNVASQRREEIYTKGVESFISK
jgi:hypothetical protein